MHYLYLITLAYCADEYADPSPAYAVIPVDADYVRSLIAKHAAVGSLPDLFFGSFYDSRATFVSRDILDHLPDYIQQELEVLAGSGDFFLAEFPLTALPLDDDWLEEIGVVVPCDVQTVQFFSGSEPQASYHGFIKHGGASMETNSIPLHALLHEIT